MLLGGLQKTTLIDFPGRLGCTVFTVGCNFRCPFCHNKDLVSREFFNKSGIKPISEDYFFQFLKKRKKILDGVCITGGEPTLQSDLIDFCQKIKKLNLEVKLDSNGSNPQVVEKLIKKKLIDFIALDVKANWLGYPQAIGLSYPLEKIKKTIKLILDSEIEYQLRTTVVPGIHNKKTIEQLAKELVSLTGKKRINYCFQQFRPKNCLDPSYLKVKPFSSSKIKEILNSVQKIIPQTELKGEE